MKILLHIKKQLAQEIIRTNYKKVVISSNTSDNVEFKQPSVIQKIILFYEL